MNWTPEEDAVVFHGSLTEAATALGRTCSSVKNRRHVIRKQLGLAHSVGFDWAACGSPGQYRKHLRWGIPMCEACRRAENRRTQDSRKKLSKVPGNRRDVMIQ